MAKLDYQSGEDALRERPRHRVLLISVAVVSVAAAALATLAKLAFAGKLVHGLFGVGLIAVAGTIALIVYAGLTKRSPKVLADVELLTLWESGDGDGFGYSIAIHCRYAIAGAEYISTRWIWSNGRSLFAPSSNESLNQSSRAWTSAVEF